MSDDGHQVTVCFHVDDLLITSKSVMDIKSLEDCLTKTFSEVTFVLGDNHSYLSTNINRVGQFWEIDMKNYIDKCLEGIVFPSNVTTSPGNDNLFRVADDDDASLLDLSEKAIFHTDVARLLYLAKRARMDILTVVSFLCSRVGKPDVHDAAKLKRLFSYLSQTKDVIMRYRMNVIVELIAYIDASFGIHDDGTSRTGMVMMIAVVAPSSARQHLVTNKSSTESEIVALSDGATPVLWEREWMIAQGYDVGPVTIYQDNKGVIALMTNGPNARNRTRHLNIRYFFVKDRIKMRHLSVLFAPNEEMIADLMTKSVMGQLCISLRSKMFGMDT